MVREIRGKGTAMKDILQQLEDRRAVARAGGDKGNKGDEAADAAVSMINLLASARAMGPGGAGRS